VLNIRLRVGSGQKKTLKQETVARGIRLLPVPRNFGNQLGVDERFDKIVEKEKLYLFD
jgi:hypothetical protein